MSRQELLDSIHAIANHAAIIDSCAEALAQKVPVVLAWLEMHLIELDALGATDALKPAAAAARLDLLEVQKIVDDLASGSRRIVTSVRHARKIVQQGGSA